MLTDLLLSTEHDTRQAYGAGLLRFNQFSNGEGIPEGRRMPASDILLGAFVAEYSGRISSKVVTGNWRTSNVPLHLFAPPAKRQISMANCLHIDQRLRSIDSSYPKRLVHS
jgi:hypothetical protein